MANKTKAPFPVFPGKGVLTRDDNPNYAKAVLSADSTPGGIIIAMPGISPVTYPTTDVTTDPDTDRISFISSQTPYRIRELREDDGSWLSNYQTFLPLTALEALMEPQKAGDMATPDVNFDMPDESLDAFAYDDSVYVVGLLYTNGAGRWSRQDGVWVGLSPNDNTFEDPDMIVIEIDPTKANQFIAMYDQNYVTVTDAENYEDQSSALQIQNAENGLEIDSAASPNTVPETVNPENVTVQ